MGNLLLQGALQGAKAGYAQNPVYPNAAVMGAQQGIATGLGVPLSTIQNNTPVNRAPAAPAGPPAGMNYDQNGTLVARDVNAGGGGQPADPYAGIRNEISSAWDNYLGQLGGVSQFIGDQRTAQEGVANSQLTQGQNTINSQKASSLRDIANTTKNAFQAGNNYLGSMGAGDSSAANQYSFAINQQANKQTGDLNNFVNTQLQTLQSTHDQQIQGIAQWFAGQQQVLKQQIAQGGLQKGQDLANLSKGILDQAMQATNALKAESSNRYNALLQWAAGNSQNMGQLQNNIAAIPQAMGQMQLGGGGMARGVGPVGGGAPQKTDIFGNVIG